MVMSFLFMLLVWQQMGGNGANGGQCLDCPKHLLKEVAHLRVFVLLTHCHDLQLYPCDLSPCFGQALPEIVEFLVPFCDVHEISLADRLQLGIEL